MTASPQEMVAGLQIVQSQVSENIVGGVQEAMLGIGGQAAFIGNEANLNGGALALGSNGITSRSVHRVVISGNAIFSGNSSRLHGGAIDLTMESGRVDVSGNVTFGGRGLEADDNISGNSSAEGGAIRVAGGELRIRGPVVFRYNRATSRGGAVLIEDGVSVDIEGAGREGRTLFDRNSVRNPNMTTGYGGAIHIEGCRGYYKFRPI